MFNGVRRWFAIGLAVIIAQDVAWTASARADEPPARVELIAGSPLGVGTMTVETRDNLGAADSPLLLVDSDGRVLYPAFERSTVRVPVQRETQPTTVTAWFLFRGAGPLQLQLRGHEAYNGEGQPIEDNERHRKLLEAWWERYAASAGAVAAADLYQPLVENYLLNTLARRLKLREAKLPAAWAPWRDVDDIVSTLSGAESIRVAAQSRALLATRQQTAADQPLPRPIAQPPVPLPKLDQPPAIEPIARHVPVECFYVRCGSFANFTWLRDTLDDWGTHVRDLTSVRGLDYRVNERIGRQLSLRDTTLGRLLGDAVISDVAIIGNDTFLREGAAIGILFEARNSAALGQQIAAQRQQTLREDKTAAEKKLKIAGREVSLLATPDNGVRSFYAVDGNYHLVTTSQNLVRRFFEAGEGKECLGLAAEYQWARTKMPLAKQHAVFVYLSDPFFREMVSPHYRIEMTRRTHAASEIDVVRLAQLAAKAEGSDARSVNELVAADLLPPGFGNRPDESHVVVAEDTVVDSLRGAYGSFLPVPDVEVPKATHGEVNAYRYFSEMYAREWQRMDPVIIGVGRQSLEGAKERITFDIHITPYARTHYGWLAGSLGPEDKERWADVPGDIAAASINFGGNKYAIGVRDFASSLALVDGQVRYNVPRTEGFPLYAASARPGRNEGNLFHFHVTPKGKPGADGLIPAQVNFLGEGWLKRTDELDIVSWSKLILNDVGSRAGFIAADRPAKLRLRVADLAATKVAVAIQAENYIRARKISAGNVYLINALTQQLHVPQEEAPAVAEQLLAARLVCPLGGKYQLQQGFSEFGHWQSDAWQAASLYSETQIPASYKPPLLDWFAGMNLEFNIDATSITTHIELDVRGEEVIGRMLKNLPYSGFDRFALDRFDPP